MTPMTHRLAGHLTAFFLGLCTVLPAAAAVNAADAALVKKSLQARGDRFVQAPGSGAKAFFANSGTQTMSFGADGIEVRPRMASASGAKSTRPAALRYQFASAAKVAPAGVKDSGVTYNFFHGSREQWETGLRSYSQLGYTALWPGIDATYSGDSKGLKYHFDVAPGADAKAIRFVVSGASQARIAADGAVEWTVGGAIVRDEVPLAYQSANGADQLVPAAFRLEALDASTWSLAIDVGTYDRAKALTVDPAWAAFAGLVGGNASDQVYAVARDGASVTYACGITASVTLPTQSAYDLSPNGDEDAFIVKFNASGALTMVTYFGGSGYDVCTGIAVDSAGSVYVTGGTTSTNFPFTGSDAAGRFRGIRSTTDRDAFVAKFVSTGQLNYSGVIGGPGDEQANGIALSGSNACVTGYTTSATGFPVYNNFGNGAALKGAMDAFVSCVDNLGSSLSFSMYVGGNGNLDVGRAIAVTGGSVVVVGETDSTSGLPAPSVGRTVADGTDAFVTKLSIATGIHEWFTLLGGTTPAGASGTDRALSVALDGSAIVVAGETDSANFPANNAGVRQGAGGPQNTLAGNMDGFVARLDANGAIVSATYLGGSGFDSAQAVIVDSDSGIYVAGNTTSSSFPTLATAGLSTTAFGGQDGFLAKLNVSPFAFAYSGFIGGNVAGGSINDSVHALAHKYNASDTNTRFAISLGGATGGNGANFTGATGSAPSGSVNGMVMSVSTYHGALSLTAVSGGGQSATVAAVFAQPLVVLLRDADSTPVSGASVFFSAPVSGASATFSPTATTGADGRAQITATANGVAGSYSVTATVDGVGSTTFSLTNVFASQTVTFAQPADKTFGDPPFALVATAAPSGFTVVFESTSPGVCTISGSVATLVGAGTCTVIASASAGGSYSAAPNVYRTFYVDKAAQAITFPAIASQTYTSGGTFPVAATSTSGLTVTFTSTTPAVCTVSGTAVTMVASGTCTIYSDQAGNANYLAAVTVSQTITINPAVAAGPAKNFDLNGDGSSDVLIRDSSNGTAYGWTMNGLSITGGDYVLAAGSGWKVVAVADLDANGKADILIEHTDGSLYARLMNGLAITNGAYLLGAGTGWSLSHTGDFNGDGRADILLKHTDGSIYVQLMDGITPIGGGFLQGPGSGWSVSQVADFDGDGKSDILLKHTDGSIYVDLMNGVSVANGAFLQAAGSAWTPTATGDFNGDGKADILITNTDGGVYLWQMDGINIVTGTYLLADGSGWSIAKAGDLDGDGKTDILIKHTDGSVYAWIMNGIAINAGTYLLGAGTGWSVSHLRDLNGDGKQDILIRHTDGSIYAWIMNGTAITTGTYLLGAGTWSVSP
jgi:hypothetical protein